MPCHGGSFGPLTGQAAPVSRLEEVGPCRDGKASTNVRAATWILATGEGERSCAWGDCPYLPEELDVYCPNCRFNFFTMEGNPPCEDPLTCPHGIEARTHIENLRAWVAKQPH